MSKCYNNDTRSMLSNEGALTYIIEYFSLMECRQIENQLATVQLFIIGKGHCLENHMLIPLQKIVLQM